MKAILACDRNMLMGLNGGLPFSCSGDMNHFTETTKGHIVVMGWNTWVSLGEKPLDDRVNVVVRNEINADYEFEIYNKFKNVAFRDVLDIQLIIEVNPNEEIFYIGGAAMFEILREHITEVILSVIDTRVDVLPNDKRVYLPCLKEFALHSVEKKEGFEVNRYVKI